MKTLEKTSLFWDVNPSDLDLKIHADFIICRVLARGDVDDVEWMMKQYGAKKVKAVFLNSPHLFDEKSFFFWCFYFGFNPAQCTPKSSIRKPGAFSMR